MNSGSSTPISFSFGTNATSTATSGSGFSFGTTSTDGFNFASMTTATTKPNFSFTTPSTSTTTPVFGNPTTGSSGGVFGNGTPSTSATGSRPFAPSGSSALFDTGGFGGLQTTQQTGLFNAATANTSQSAGLFSGRMPTATTATAFQAGSAGASTNQSTGLFSGRMATPTTATTFQAGSAGASMNQSTGLFSGRMATPITATGLPSGGSTTLFSGVAARPPFSFNPSAPSPQSSGITFGTPKQTTQGSTIATGVPVFGSVTPSLNTKQTELRVPSQETMVKQGISFGGATTAVSSGGTPSFGTTQTASTGGNSFGVSASTTTTKPGITAAPVTTGLMQGGTSAATTQQGSVGAGFKLGCAPATTAQATPGFTFGGATQGPGSTLTSGATLTSGTTLDSGTTLASGTTLTSVATPASKQVTQPVQSLALGQSTTGFNFSGQLGGEAKTTARTTSTSNSAKPSITGTNQNLVFAARVKSTFPLPSSTPTLTTTSTGKSTFGLNLPPTSISTSTTGFPLGGTPAGGLGTTATTTTSTGFKLPTSTAVANLTSKAATSATTTATTSTTSSEKYTYKQLEDQVNKWNIELEDMEKTFLEQAAQVNVADRELMENGEKIAVLHNEVERAKAEQNRLDQELDFLVSQQNELEDLLKPLEESVKQHSAEYSQEPDREREKIYTMAENCDAQLKGMVQDLKEVIDYLNASNANQQKEDNPVIQIAKILNVHMDSLQWIDQNSALLQKRVDEISRLSDMRRKEHERSFRLDFD